MRFIRACEPIDDARDGGWFEEFSALVDEIVETRLLMDALPEMLGTPELYVTGR